MQAASRDTGGDLDSALTKALVGIATEQLPRGPTSAVTIHGGNVVLAVMHGVLCNAEKTLVQNGSQDDIDQARRLFRQVVEADFRAAVEQLTGRRVIAFFGANHPEPDVADEIFVLDEPV